MITKEPLKVSVTKLLLMMLLMVQIIGCGSSDATHRNTKPTNITPVSSFTSTVRDPSAIPPSELTLKTTMNGLQINGLYHCALSKAFSGIVLSNTVLAQPQTSNYESDTMIKITEYMKSLLSASTTKVELPTALQNVLGASTDDSCFAYWNIANTGKTAVEIAGVGFQLTAPSQKNNYHYRLIDGCNAFPAPDVSAICVNGGGAPVLNANINLTYAKAGTSFTGKLSGTDPVNNVQVNQGNGPVILNSNSILTAYIYFFSSGTSGNLIYSGNPEILLDTSDGVQPIKLPQVALAFANKSQFSCYTLQKNGFTPEEISANAFQCI